MLQYKKRITNILCLQDDPQIRASLCYHFQKMRSHYLGLKSDSIQFYLISIEGIREHLPAGTYKNKMKCLIVHGQESHLGRSFFKSVPSALQHTNT